MIETKAIYYILAFAFAPLLVGLLAWLTQTHTVRDRKSRTGRGRDERDAFEVKNAILGALGAAIVRAEGFRSVLSR